jgi:hypothetical protein
MPLPAAQALIIVGLPHLRVSAAANVHSGAEPSTNLKKAALLALNADKDPPLRVPNTGDVLLRLDAIKGLSCDKKGENRCYGVVGENEKDWQLILTVRKRAGKNVPYQMQWRVASLLMVGLRDRARCRVLSRRKHRPGLCGLQSAPARHDRAGGTVRDWDR